MFNNAIEFSTFIEQKAWEHDMGLLEYLTHYVTENSIEEDTIPELLTPALKNKIEAEARKQYSMPKQTTGEIDL